MERPNEIRANAAEELQVEQIKQDLRRLKEKSGRGGNIKTVPSRNSEESSIFSAIAQR
jgi:hypothetical protein